jgi:hypothetical protein
VRSYVANLAVGMCNNGNYGKKQPVSYSYRGHAVAQAVGHWLPTPAA